ncbi:(2Fe-2S)-binding protein [Hyphomicrobium nitrativorans NL23]|uniref:(2Fe-2S)-binding protein n=1 Tax=Hyphomicrobium nitrativorans NL23 TaxID=1029756 RepID=V5SCC8_9HYPH|nr:ubiquinol-cytochrome c reductase iron-sulfur subunit [Hyphomicrobium nitrativorans]AHB48178.1 (2Fe-2S)-binding protein [Hyphomicrobium nitrativorans NL23]
MQKDTRTRRDAGGADEDQCEVGRRNVLQGLAFSCCAVAAGIAASAPADAQTTRGRRAEPGHRFAFMTGDKEGEVVAPSDVKIGEQPLLVYPMDAETGDILASRANLLILMRVPEGDLDPSMEQHAAAGIVAYSAICTHEGCPISGQHENPRMAVCNCHGSTFDVGNNGVVVQGPAVRRLAMLPVTITDGALVVAGKLNGPIGPPA